jgi:hypothetical protein
MPGLAVAMSVIAGGRHPFAASASSWARSHYGPSPHVTVAALDAAMACGLDHQDCRGRFCLSRNVRRATGLTNVLRVNRTERLPPNRQLFDPVQISVRTKNKRSITLAPTYLIAMPYPFPRINRGNPGTSIHFPRFRSMNISKSTGPD